MLEIFVRLQSLMTVQREKGATAVEYGLMVALIAIVIITAVGTVGTNLITVFEDIAAELTGVAGG
ncbi:Flp family type IVb pilin [Raoultella terrigena]|uniref:Flp family type IVb pilin n=1 Tax=Raoultella terrigena TaxID=577 RepID=UPI00133083DE|nr:Flp family type IVb pilin [Raoultella terrigena]